LTAQPDSSMTTPATATSTFAADDIIQG
jgi:hypothetical protein